MMHSSCALLSCTQVRIGFKTVPLPIRDENGELKNALCWDGNRKLWLCLNTYKETSGGQMVPHTMKLSEWMETPQVDALLQDPLMIKDLHFVDKIGRPLTMAEAIAINDKFGERHACVCTQVLRARKRCARAHTELNAKLSLFGLPLRTVRCTDFGTDVAANMSGTPRRTFGSTVSVTPREIGIHANQTTATASVRGASSSSTPVSSGASSAVPTVKVEDEQEEGASSNSNGKRPRRSLGGR
jgi:hypothetical protein